MSRTAEAAFTFMRLTVNVSGSCCRCHCYLPSRIEPQLLKNQRVEWKWFMSAVFSLNEVGHSSCCPCELEQPIFSSGEKFNTQKGCLLLLLWRRGMLWGFRAGGNGPLRLDSSIMTLETKGYLRAFPSYILSVCKILCSGQKTALVSSSLHQALMLEGKVKLGEKYVVSMYVKQITGAVWDCTEGYVLYLNINELGGKRRILTMFYT